jgi:PAS domain S-box-containing protein
MDAEHRDCSAQKSDSTSDLSDDPRREREALLASAFRRALIGLVFTTPDGEILDANATYLRMIGYSREEIAERDSGRFTHPDDVAATKKFYASLQNPEQPAGILEKRYLHKSGHIVWARISATMRHDASGHPTQLVAIIEDVSEQKRAEKTLSEKARIAALGADIGAALTRIAPLQESLQHCAEAIVKNLDVAFARIWTLRPGETVLELQASAGLYTHRNGAHSRITVGSFKIGAIARDRQAHLSNNVAEDPLVSDKAWAKQENMVAFAGHPLIIDDHVIGVLGVFARRILEADVLAALGSISDSIAVGIKRKGAEETVVRQWHLFDTALSHTPDFTYMFDLDGRFTYVNLALLSLWGKTLAEALGKNFFELGYPTDLALRLQQQIQEVIATRRNLRDQTPYTSPAGKQGFYEYIFVPVLDQAGQVTAVAGSTRDISEHIRMAEVLSAGEKKLQQVFSQAPVAIVVFRGRDFVIELANDTYRAMLQGRELVGRRFLDVVPELSQDVWNVFNQVLDTGEPFVANEWPMRYDADGDGSPEDHWFNVVYNPLRETDGAISGLIAVLTDVTVQVRAREDLERANRELEEFAYVASHDLQEPLRMVNIYADLLLRRQLNTDAEATKYVAFISSGVRRMEGLIGDLLTFSRTVHTEERSFGQANLSESLSEALLVLKDLIEKLDALVTVGALPSVRGETAQLGHVFQNLISNALKYRKTDLAPQIVVAALRQGDKWIISVKDNGIGFDPQYADRIFGLFKRLHKEEYPGTGLGLAICKRIVERYGGRIWAESRIGEGATFFFSLPGVEAE